jgi:lysophospholipase L1-like esterase
LRDGDRVVFFGDSITEQRLYTTYIEEYVLTRFPGRNISFVNSGVGGDKVSGGWAGPIDMRLQRDVYAYHPTLITIMLGMNDGYYRQLEPGIFTTYADGYRHIVEQLQANLPQAKLTLIQPSPFDDVTRAPKFDPGYNATMLRFGELMQRIAREKHTLVADLNTPVVDAITKAKALDAAMSTTLIEDRVHPGSGVHWLMAEAVLKAWGAPAIVTSVHIDAAKAKSGDLANTEITQLRKTKSTLEWVQNDHALPLPFSPPEVDPFTEMAARVSDLNQALNLQLLYVEGLAPGTYELRIDEHPVGMFTNAQFAAGVELAQLETPMLAQSRLLALDTERKNSIEEMHFNLANSAQEPLEKETVKKLEAALVRAIERQRKDAQPVAHRYSVVMTTTQKK